MAAEDCTCFEPESWRDDFEKTMLGVDRTKGRFGEVSIDRCRQCGRLWLHYFVEYEAVPQSGRWYRGLITPEAARSVTPEGAVAILEGLPWRLYGGSYFGKRGERSTGPVLLDP